MTSALGPVAHIPSPTGIFVGAWSAPLAPNVPTLVGEPLLDLSPGALVLGDVVRGVVGVESVNMREGRKGPFWTPRLRTATGAVGGKAWTEMAPQMLPLTDGALAVVEAKVCPEYGNERFGVELELLRVRVLDVAECPVDFWDLCNPRYAGNVLALRAELDALVAGFRPAVRALYDAVMAVAGLDDFLEAPGAPGIGHHGYLHGLLEHSLEVARGVDAMCAWPRYRGRVDRDFAVCAALLHDIGKVREYAWRGTQLSRASAGRFSSHTVIGAELVAVAAVLHADALAAAGCDDPLVEHLKHVCVSHHEKSEHGSPVPPASREGGMVAVQDKASADVAGLDDAVTADRSAGADGFSQTRILFRPRGVYHTPLPPPVGAAGESLKETPAETALV